MVSNALSARRGPLRRPKVCLSHPNPGRCEPPPPPPVVSCSIIPGAITVDLGDIPGFRLLHCNLDLPVGAPLDVDGDVPVGLFIINEGSVNCREGSAEYQTAEVGVFVCTMTVTYSDLSICVAETTVTVVEP